MKKTRFTEVHVIQTLTETPAIGKDIFRYSPKSKRAKENFDVAAEIISLKH